MSVDVGENSIRRVLIGSGRAAPPAALPKLRAAMLRQPVSSLRDGFIVYSDAAGRKMISGYAVRTHNSTSGSEQWIVVAPTSITPRKIPGKPKELFT